MNEATVKQTKEFVFLRLSEPFPFSDDKTTPAYLAAMVAGLLLLFALLSVVLPMVRTMRGVMSGLLARGAAWVALASAGVVAWLAMTQATDTADTGLRGQLFWAHLGGQLLLALLFGVSGLMTLLGGDRLGKGGNTEGVLFGALLTTLFGRVDTGPFGWWKLFAAGYRALLYLIPVACLGIARGFETDPEPVWWLFTAAMLGTACNLTLHMYLKDSGEPRWWGGPVLLLIALSPLVLSPLLVGLFVLLVVAVRSLRESLLATWLKVTPLAVLRCLTLAALAFCFLLPAMQPWETAEKRSRVVVVVDVSPSMTKWSDDISRDPNAKLKTRMDKVLDFLTSADGEFTARLLEKNPVVVYRLGSTLDPEPGVIRRGPDDSPAKFAWTRDEWVSFVEYDFKAWALGYEGPDGKGFSDDAKQALRDAAAWGAGPGDAEWVLTWSKAGDAEIGAGKFAEDEKDAPDVRLRKATDRKLLAGVREKAVKRVDMARIIAGGSAVPDGVTAAINREQSNMTQAVVVFSDGRSNMSSDAAIPDLTRRAKEANIPVYTVSVGSAREVVSIVISDLQAPDRTQPDEPTQVTVAVDGIGFKQNDAVEVTLELFLPGKDPKNNDVADYEMKQTVTFGPGETPHGETTFLLDAEEFAKKGAASLIEEISPPKPGRKWQLKKGQWKVRAKVPVDPREIFREPNHLSPVRNMEVMDKPLRVLLAAGAPTREFQILRTLLVREAEQKRAELCIFLQNEGGAKGTIVQDVPPGRLLLKFPDELDVSKDTSVGQGGDPGSDAETLRQRAKYNNLNEYDLIICFDPNWREQDDSGQFRIPTSAFQKLKTWSQNYGGGLIYVAGPFYTAQLMRSDAEGGRLKPLLDMLPVEPDDIVASDDLTVKLNTRKVPRRLKFNPPKDSDVLRLDEFTPQKDEALKAVAGWETFFTDAEVPPKKVEKEYLEPKRGFYTYYPVKKVKPLASSLAEFLNVDEKGQEVARPFYAVGPSGAGRTAWIGSGEIFRLRAVPEVGISFYDKFWLQAARYCSAKRTTGAKARGDVLMSKEVITGTPIRVRARVLQSSGEPYQEDGLDKPKVVIEQLDQNGNVTDKMGPFDVLKPAKLGTKFEGYYQGVINPDPAKMKVDGFRYRVNVIKADLPEPLTAEFILRSANPELDNTKPDLAALREMASPVKVATDLEPDAGKRTALAARLGLTDDEVKSGKAKLAFALDDPTRLKVIPDLIRSRSESPQNRGIVDPLWDDSFDPAEDKVTAWLRGASHDPAAPEPGPQLSDLFRIELVRFNAGSSSVVVRAWMPVVLVQLILLALTFALRAAADKPAMSTLVLVLGCLVGFLTLSGFFLLGVILPVIAFAFRSARGPVVTGMLGLSAVVQLLAAETVVCAGTGLNLGLWLPATLLLQLALAVTWVLRTRVDLPKSGVLGFLEGVAVALLGLAFIPLGLAAALPPVVGLYGQVFGEMPWLAQVLLYGSTLLPGVGLAGVYALAGRYRGAVGSVVLTLTMLAQALAAALAVWYGNPFPVGYAVLALAALLCSEWTFRKLLRLA